MGWREGLIRQGPLFRGDPIRIGRIRRGSLQLPISGLIGTWQSGRRG